MLEYRNSFEAAEPSQQTWWCKHWKTKIAACTKQINNKELKVNNRRFCIMAIKYNIRSSNLIWSKFDRDGIRLPIKFCKIFFIYKSKSNSRRRK
jgi:hypothetical protein